MPEETEENGARVDETAMRDASDEIKPLSPADLGTLFEEDWGEWDRAWASEIETVRKFRALYDSHGSSPYGIPEDSAMSQVSVMECFRVAETVFANMVSSIWGQKPWFTTSAPTSDAAATEGVAEWERILNHVLKNPFAHFGTKRDIYLRDLVLTGTGVCETVWNLRRRWVDGGKEYEPQEIGDGPTIEPVLLSDFAFEPHGTDVDAESSAWIDIAKDPLAGLMRNKLLALRSVPGARVDMELFEQAVRDGGDNKENEETAEIKKRLGMGEATPKGRLHINERWSAHPGARRDAPDIQWLFVRVNREHVVAQVPNPFRYGFRPVLKATFIPRANSFYGKGIGHLALKEQTQINHVFAMLYTKLLLWVYGPYVTDQATDVNMQILVKPGGVLSRSRYGNIDPMAVDLTGFPYVMSLLEYMKNDLRTSANASVTAQAQVTDTTAAENKQVALDTMKRNMPTFEHVIDSFVRPMLMRFIELCEQFLPEKIVIEEQRRDGRYVQRTINKSELPPAPSVYVNPVTDMDHSAAMIRRLTSFLDGLVQYASVFGEDLKEKGFDPAMWIKKIAHAFGENPNDVFNDERGDAYKREKLAAQTQAQMQGRAEEAKHQATIMAAVEEQRAFGKPGLAQPRMGGTVDESIGTKRRARARKTSTAS